MMKRNAFILLTVFGISCTIILLFFYLTKGNEVLSGDFSRNMIRAKPDLKIVFNLRIGTDYIAGQYADSIFLGNSMEIDSVESLNYINGKSKSHFVHHGVPAVTRFVVQHPYAFQIDEMNKRIVRTNLSDSSDVKEFTLPPFTDAIALQGNSFALRTFNDSKTELQLGKFSGDTVQRFPLLLQKQLDGILCTDGMLAYNEEEKRLFYIYYYRNQFLCLDSSMNLLFRGRTIDSISHVKIKVAITHDEKNRKLGSPARLVNSFAYSFDSLFFVLSHVVGKTEHADAHRNGSMIDCYRIRDGLYRYSIYLSNYKSQKLKQFAIADSQLFALYRNYLVVYSLH
jgi:hypothetical protein